MASTPLNNPAHNAALVAIELLMGAKFDTPEGRLLEGLATAVAAYEKETGD